jgi:hypothetical protein
VYSHSSASRRLSSARRTSSVCPAVWAKRKRGTARAETKAAITNDVRKIKVQTSAELIRIRRPKISEKRAPCDLRRSSFAGQGLLAETGHPRPSRYPRHSGCANCCRVPVPCAVTVESDYQGACTPNEITLSALSSYSYRADSTDCTFALCGCAQPLKSPTIKIVAGDLPKRCGGFGKTLASNELGRQKD